MNLVFELFDQDSIINARASAQNEVETCNRNVQLLATKMKSIQKMSTLNFNEILICLNWPKEEIGLKILTVN